MAWRSKARWSAAIAGLLAALCVGCGDDGNGDGGGEFTDAEAKQWATRYVKEVESWARAWTRANRAAGRQDFAEAGRIVMDLGWDADQARGDFGNVPTNLRYGEELYDRLIDAADAAGQWALIYRTNAPPYRQTPSGLRASQRVAGASADFGRRLNVASRFFFAHKNEPLTE